MKVDVVVGAQFGSEAKGHVTQRILEQANLRGETELANVRVAGPNAGHTAHSPTGVRMAFRQLPVGALQPHVDCFIAAGSEISPEVLLEEIDRAIRHADFNPSCLVVDDTATLLESRHVQAETGMHESIGSTGKGIGAARADRIMRKARQVKDDEELVKHLRNLGVSVGSVADELLLGYYSRIVVEGTQGFGLGLHAGYYPFCTSSDCRAIDFLAMAGINPWLWGDVDVLRVVAVARVYPIRVAGNSGPLVGETTWEGLGLPPEFTTVTNKMRRVGEWDPTLVREAVMANGGAPVVELAVTMLDQKFPDLAGVTEVQRIREHTEAMDWLAGVDIACGARVSMVTTGPNTGVWL